MRRASAAVAGRVAVRATAGRRLLGRLDAEHVERVGERVHEAAAGLTSTVGGHIAPPSNGTVEVSTDDIEKVVVYSASSVAVSISVEVP